MGYVNEGHDMREDVITVDIDELYVGDKRSGHRIAGEEEYVARVANIITFGGSEVDLTSSEINVSDPVHHCCINSCLASILSHCSDRSIKCFEILLIGSLVVVIVFIIGYMIDRGIKNGI